MKEKSFFDTIKELNNLDEQIALPVMYKVLFAENKEEIAKKNHKRNDKGISSTFYRAKETYVVSFYKPISRTFKKLAPNDDK